MSCARKNQSNTLEGGNASVASFALKKYARCQRCSDKLDVRTTLHGFSKQTMSLTRLSRWNLLILLITLSKGVELTLADVDRDPVSASELLMLASGFSGGPTAHATARRPLTQEPTAFPTAPTSSPTTSSPTAAPTSSPTTASLTAARRHRRVKQVYHSRQRSVTQVQPSSRRGV